MRTLAAAFVCLGFLPSLLAPAGGPPALARLLPDEIAGLKPRGEDRIFTRETVGRFLDGAGGTCLAFGFRRLLVRDYGKPEGDSVLVAEIYDMSGSGDAYGFFSSDQDGEDAGIGRGALYHGGILRFWKGPYCVRVLAKDEIGEAKRLVLGLGVRIAAKIPEDGDKPALVACLPPEHLKEKSVRYFHKQVSLDASYYLADENALLLSEKTEVALGQYTQGWGEVLLLVCRYPAPADARRAYLRFGRDYFPVKIDPAGREVVAEIDPGEFAGARRTGSFLILVLESPGRRNCESLLRAAEARTLEVFAPGKTRPPGAR